MKVKKVERETVYKLALSRRELGDLRIALFWAKKDESGAYSHEKVRMLKLYDTISIYI